MNRSKSKKDLIVFTKGIPIRITGAAMGSCDENSHEPLSIRGHPSVDSYLSALEYTNIPGTVKIYLSGSGGIGYAYSNRYWNATEPFSHAKLLRCPRANGVAPRPRRSRPIACDRG